MKITKEGYAVIEGDTHISAWVEQTGLLAHDEWAMRRILPLIPEGGTVVDIGAFIGDHTAAYKKKVGPTGKVYAFEPNPEAFECLAYNCPDCDCRDIALTWYEFEDLKMRKESNAGATYTTLLENGVPCRCSYLDTQLFGIDRCDFIKIDVEGDELKVLIGAERTIFEFQPVMLVEVNEPLLQRKGSSRESLFQLLEVFNYRWEIMQPTEKVTDPQYDIICRPL
jgi:FkbM family methyltransferase